MTKESATDDAIVAIPDEVEESEFTMKLKSLLIETKVEIERNYDQIPTFKAIPSCWNSASYK